MRKGHLHVCTCVRWGGRVEKSESNYFYIRHAILFLQVINSYSCHRHNKLYISYNVATCFDQLYRHHQACREHSDLKMKTAVVINGFRCTSGLMIYDIQLVETCSHTLWRNITQLVVLVTNNYVLELINISNVRTHKFVRHQSPWNFF
jgi:hypothetical protein